MSGASVQGHSSAGVCAEERPALGRGHLPALWKEKVLRGGESGEAVGALQEAESFYAARPASLAVKLLHFEPGL